MDTGATILYGTDYAMTGSVRTGMKAIFAGISAGLDIFLNASVAVKPAFYASRYYSTATGRYVSNLAGTARAYKPYLIGGAVDLIGDAANQ